MKEKHSAYAQAEAKTKEYRQMLEKCQADKEILKRENYRLQYRIDELELLLKQRDEIVEELQQKTNMTRTVKFLK